MKKKQTFIKPNDRFGRLVAIKYLYTGKHHRRYFLFKCDCGNEKIIQVSSLTSGNTRSCGCLAREIKKEKLLPDNRGVINQIILGYKRHAIGRGLEWNLKYEEVYELISKNCYYCGLPPTNMKITKNCKKGFTYSGIDRIDSSKNYDINNVVPCCALCNKAKGNLSISEFFEWMKRICNMADTWG
jgi:5-methylcytosine-specific restriction endonuclease McrA